MKHSDINRGENSCDTHLFNRNFSSNNQQMSANISTASAVMISNPLHPNSSTILSTPVNTFRTNIALLAKPNPMSTTAINSNMIGNLTCLNSNSNSIKLVNLSKCSQLQNLNKDNANIATNNAINVQLVTPILNNATGSLNDPANSLTTKSDNSSTRTGSVILNSSSNPTMMTSNNSITCTRFILHSSQAQILPHGTVTIIPQRSDITSNNLLSSNLIKTARFTLSGTKSTPQAIRPISVSSAPVVSVAGLSKPSISKISPTKSITNYTINMSDGTNTISLQDLSIGRNLSVSKEQQRGPTKATPIKPISYTITSSNNNIRLALTSSITNSKINMNSPKIQLISPKSRKRSGSPINVTQDAKLRESLIGSKDENMEHPAEYNSQSDCCSPARKRARKQHLKTVNSKLQKSVTNHKIDSNSPISNARYTVADKIISTPISIAPTIAKFENIVSQNKLIEETPISTPQLIIPLKNPIHICTSKAPAFASIYANQLNANNGVLSSSNPNNIGNINQVQIITSSSNARSLQLPANSHNFILSPKVCKSLAVLSPQKVIHIAPCRATNNHIQAVLNQRILPDNALDDNKDTVVKKPLIVGDRESDKVDRVPAVKAELTEDVHVKYSLFPVKCQWNSRRSHFEKELDVKIKKSTSHTGLEELDTEQERSSTEDSEVYDTSWRLFKARTQILMQKCFDEENLKDLIQLKDKFDITHQKNDDSDNDEPVFQTVCLHQHHHEQLPDQIDSKCFSDFTDPNLFGISDDIIHRHINVLASDRDSSQPPDGPDGPLAHQCSETCQMYAFKVPAIHKPPQILRIIDLIEGLITKEKMIIEKESVINDKCLRLLQSGQCSPLSVGHVFGQSDKVKGPSGRHW